MEVGRRIVVVGASLAGLRSIEALRREGHAGEIIALSAEKHLPYDRPPLSKQYLKGEWEADKISLRRQGFEELAIDWRLGTAATRLDPNRRLVELADGSALEYGGLLIATGSRARRLPGMDNMAGVHVLRDLDDATRLREELARASRLVVIGAGFIGMEVAASARELGLEVTVVEALSAPLLRGLGAELGDYVGARFRDHGVSLRCGMGVDGFVGEKRVEGVRLADGSMVPADVVLVGIGVAPVTEWLDGSNLDTSNGVLCDAHGATTLPDVVAAGDAARWHNPLIGRAVRYEHWTSAVEQSGVAAARLLAGNDGGAGEGLRQVPYVWSDQLDMRIAIAGEVTEASELHICHGTREEGRFLALFGRGGRLCGAVAFRRPRQLNDARELIERGASFAEAVAANA